MTHHCVIEDFLCAQIDDDHATCCLRRYTIYIHPARTAYISQTFATMKITSICVLSLVGGASSFSGSITKNVAVPGLENGMDYCKLGKSDLEVSKVCMGTMTFGEQVRLSLELIYTLSRWKYSSHTLFLFNHSITHFNMIMIQFNVCNINLMSSTP